VALSLKRADFFGVKRLSKAKSRVEESKEIYRELLHIFPSTILLLQKYSQRVLATCNNSHLPKNYMRLLSITIPNRNSRSKLLNGSSDTSMVIVLVSREIVTPFGNFPAELLSAP
jgi:hypothetical protein